MLLLRLLGFDSVAGPGAGAGGAGAGAVTSAALDVSIFFSGDGSAERGGLFVFFVTLGLAVVVCLGLASFFAGVAALVLAVEEAEEEEDQEEEREDEDEPERDLDPLLELLPDEL